MAKHIGWIKKLIKIWIIKLDFKQKQISSFSIGQNNRPHFNSLKKIAHSFEIAWKIVWRSLRNTKVILKRMHAW